MVVNERRLFERLVAPDPPGSAHREVDISRLTRSVVDHLSKMMNSRHGCTQIQPDFGIPDLNEFLFDFPDSIGSMRRAVQTAIERFEPRLQSVRVQYIENPDNPLEIQLEISAKLITDTKPVPISFSTKSGSISGFQIDE